MLSEGQFFGEMSLMTGECAPRPSSRRPTPSATSSTRSRSRRSCRRSRSWPAIISEILARRQVAPGEAPGDGRGSDGRPKDAAEDQNSRVFWNQTAGFVAAAAIRGRTSTGSCRRGGRPRGRCRCPRRRCRWRDRRRGGGPPPGRRRARACGGRCPRRRRWRRTSRRSPSASSVRVTSRRTLPEATASGPSPRWRCGGRAPARARWPRMPPPAEAVVVGLLLLERERDRGSSVSPASAISIAGDLRGRDAAQRVEARPPGKVSPCRAATSVQATKCAGMVSTRVPSRSKMNARSGLSIFGRRTLRRTGPTCQGPRPGRAARYRVDGSQSPRDRGSAKSGLRSSAV